MWLIVVLITFLSVAFYIHLRKKYNFWRDRRVPHLKPTYLLGNLGPTVFRIKSLRQVIEDVYTSFPKNRYVGFYNANEPVLILRDPELIKDVTIKDFESFPDHRKFVPPNVDVLWEKNLFQMNTEDGWHTMRSILSPSFSSSKMKQMFQLMEECVTQLVDHFKSQNEDISLEVQDVFTRITNDIIATCAFGIQCNSLKNRDNEFYVMGREASDFSGFKALKLVGHGISSTLMKLFNIKMFNSRVSSFFRKVINENLSLRKKNDVIRPDMIHLLLEASKRLGNLTEEERSKLIKTELTQEDITAQALIFFFAGFDTVSSAMCYLCYELAINPEIQRQLYDEIRETVETSSQPTYESITSMKYLDCVISESLRLHSFAPVMDRQCQKSYVIKPVHPSEKPLHIQKGQLIWIPSYSIHRDEQYYLNPLKFDPERFNTENRSKINWTMYLPFGVGPRMCIGSRFALLELKLLIVEILRNFEIVPNEKTEVPLSNSIASLNGLPDKAKRFLNMPNGPLPKIDLCRTLLKDVHFSSPSDRVVLETEKSLEDGLYAKSGRPPWSIIVAFDEEGPLDYY
ncbi:hypothetical protein FQA39_LY15386 [Lamprigera yunnana]|nr:hypothetical protein FQA39_LY15386 [Lamprigera yunnana]